MTDEKPKYEEAESKILETVINTGEIPENLSEEELKNLCNSLIKEGNNLLEMTKTLEASLNSLLTTIDSGRSATAVQLESIMDALKIVSEAEELNDVEEEK